jgi:hypothetical protein
VIESVRAVADAVLYEGFFLFPYSKRALKNQRPFQFGVVMPQGYADPSEPASVGCEFVYCPDGDRRIDGCLRFLHIGDEPVEREVSFNFRAGDEPQRLPFEAGGLRGTILVSSECVDQAYRMCIELRNENGVAADEARNQALASAFVSAHFVLAAESGAFASMLDAPEVALPAVASCRNERLYPVLIGEQQAGSNTSPLLLLSPIILYDFPRIAQASKTRTFDGTEIDELLMLSVASLTDEEKRDARAAHPYVRELVERAEALDAQTLESLHGELTGTAREPGDETVQIAGVTIGKGARVRVFPKGRADVWDEIVRGMTGRVNAVHTDFEGKRYIGVLFDNDPAADIHEWYGRSFFYGVDEVEPLP